METNVNNKYKAFTSLEQSKKLAEILPLESADMYYSHEFVNSAGDYYKPNFASEGYFDDEELLGSDIPCWSLAALLNVLPEIQGCKPVIALDDNYITYPHMRGLHTKTENLIDACVAMIEKLHYLNLL